MNYIFVRMYRALILSCSSCCVSILQDNIAPMTWLILSIAPAGRRVHRISGLYLAGPAVLRGNPASLVQSPGDQQQSTGRRQRDFPMLHILSPCPLPRSPVIAASRASPAPAALPPAPWPPCQTAHCETRDPCREWRRLVRYVGPDCNRICVTPPVGILGWPVGILGCVRRLCWSGAFVNPRHPEMQHRLPWLELQQTTGNFPIV